MTECGFCKLMNLLLVDGRVCLLQLMGNKGVSPNPFSFTVHTSTKMSGRITRMQIWGIKNISTTQYTNGIFDVLLFTRFLLIRFYL